MKKYLVPLIVIVVSVVVFVLLDDEEPPLTVSDDIAARIAQKIWMNEGAGKRENLVVWNEGEHFPSLGIGHFIWYPKGVSHTFKESFPDLIQFIAEKREVPGILTLHPYPPWNSRQQFVEQLESPYTEELKLFLDDTKTEQAQFIIARMKAALPAILATLSENSRQHVKSQFDRVAKHPNGLYALIDYTNFKGEGISPKERYQDKGWGLAQVLLHMKGDVPVMEDFVAAADFVLTRRVENAPRDESRWLPGWRKRLQTYLID